MFVLERYIVLTVLRTTLLTVCVVCAIVFFLAFLEEARTLHTIEDSITAIQDAVIVLPTRLFAFIPVIVLIGISTGLGIFVARSELIACMALGMTKRRIICITASTALIFGSILLIAVELLTPLAHAARQNKVQHRNSTEDVWLTVDNRVVSVKETVHNRTSVGIYTHNQTYTALTHIDTAPDVVSIDNGDQFLKTPTEITFPAGRTTDIVYSYPDTKPFRETGVVAATHTHAFETITSLRARIAILTGAGINIHPIAFLLWQRLFTPFAALAVVLLTLPLLFSVSLRNTSIGGRIFSGITIGVSFYLFSQLIGHLFVLQAWPPLLGTSLPIILACSYAIRQLIRTG